MQKREHYDDDDDDAGVGDGAFERSGNRLKRLNEIAACSRSESTSNFLATWQIRRTGSGRIITAKRRSSRIHIHLVVAAAAASVLLLLLWLWLLLILWLLQNRYDNLEADKLLAQILFHHTLELESMYLGFT